MKKVGTWLLEQSVALSIYFMLGVFPFCVHDGFLDISEAKSAIFVASSACLVCACIVGTALSGEAGQLRKRENWCLYVAIPVLLLSAFHSAYPDNVMWGEQGRYQGTVVYLAYCLAGICIISFGSFRKSYLWALLLSGTAVSVIGILNFYEIDPLRMVEKIVEHQNHQYLSTIGHMNTFAAYLSILVPAAVGKAVWEEHGRKRILWYGCSLFGFLGMLASTCDSVYITLGVLAAALPFFCAGSRARLRRCVEVATICILGLVACQMWNYRLKYPLGYLDGILMDFDSPWRLMAAALLAALLWALYFGVRRWVEPTTARRQRLIWLALLLVASGIALWQYVSRTEFDALWGSNRGFIWAQGVDFYGKQPWDMKLLGIGMDCVLPAFHAFYGSEATLVQGSAYYNNLHNEYLQYLVTLGLLGLLAYLAALVGGVVGAFRRGVRDDQGDFMAIGLAGLCYAVQAATNISMSSVTGVLVVLLAVGELRRRKTY